MIRSKAKEQKMHRHMEFLMEVYERTRDTFAHVALTKITQKHSVQSIAVLVMIENKLIEVENIEAKKHRRYKWASSIPPNIRTAEKLIDLIDKKFELYKDKQLEADVSIHRHIEKDDRQFPHTEGFAVTVNRTPYIKMALNMVGKSISDDLLYYIDDITYLINRNDGDVTFNEIASLSSFKKLQLAGVKLPGTNQIQ